MTAVAYEDDQPWKATLGQAVPTYDALRQASRADNRTSTRPCQSDPHTECCAPAPDGCQASAIVWAVPEIPPCLLSAATVADLVAKMWELKHWAADPGFRKLERRTEDLERRAKTCRALPHSTLHRTMTRWRMPSREQLELFVRACGAEAYWYEWDRAWRAVDANMTSSGKPRHRRR